MADERAPQRIGIKAWLTGIVAGLIAIALMIAAYSAGYHEGKKTARNERGAVTTAKPVPKTTTPAVAGPGRGLFAAKCGACHTLGDAGTKGAVGPNLDDLKPDVATVRAAIEGGGTGSGAMPPNLLAGTEAQQVAAYVAGVAGR